MKAILTSLTLTVSIFNGALAQAEFIGSQELQKKVMNACFGDKDPKTIQPEDVIAMYKRANPELFERIFNPEPRVSGYPLWAQNYLSHTAGQVMARYTATKMDSTKECAKVAELYLTFENIGTDINAAGVTEFGTALFGENGGWTPGKVTQQKLFNKCVGKHMIYEADARETAGKSIGLEVAQKTGETYLLPESASEGAYNLFVQKNLVEKNANDCDTMRAIHAAAIVKFTQVNKKAREIVKATGLTQASAK